MISALVFLVAAQTPRIETFAVKGVERKAILVVPIHPDPKSPLIFFFHGHGGTMLNGYRHYDIEKLWPKAIVVYPQGLPTKGKTDPDGLKNGWQQSPGQEGDRDLAFFDTMLASLKKEYQVDSDRIYVTGHSNGGRFTYLLWAKRGSIFAAVAPCSSPAFGLARDLKPLPAFITAGKQDAIVPFLSQQLSIDAVRRILKTDPRRATVNGNTTIEPGPGGIELGTYIFDGPHSYPQGALEQAITFFKRHAK